MPSTPFFIPDTSPLFIYSPSNSWLGAYKSKGDGWDQTFHLTDNGDAIVGINVTASTIKFQTSTSSPKKEESNECEIQYRINGSDWSDGCSDPPGEIIKADLPSGIHQVELKGKDGKGFEFMGIEGDLPIQESGNAINQTIDNNSPSFVYSTSDQWTKVGATSNPDEAYSNLTLKTMYENENIIAFYRSSLAGTTMQGAKVELTFQGEAIYVYGLSGPNCGSAQVSLDGEVQHEINMTNTWDTHGSLLYMGGGFSPNDTHILSLMNSQQGQQLIIDYALLTIPKEEAKSHIPLIAGISSGVSALLILVGLCWLINVRRTKRKISNSKRSQPQYAFASGISKDGVINSGKSFGSSSSINDWRRPPSSLLSPNTPASASGRSGEYIWGTGRPAGLDLSSTRSPNQSQQPLTRTPQTGLGTGTTLTNLLTSNNNGLPRSPPPDYPDYIPYQPPPPENATTITTSSGKSAYRPVIPRSATTPLPTSSTPSTSIPTPTTTATNGWVQSANRAISPSSSSAKSTKKSISPLIERINSLNLNSNSTRMNKPEYDDIALNDYNPNHNHNHQIHNTQNPITPPPIPSEYGDYTASTSTSALQTPYVGNQSNFTNSPSTILTNSPQSSNGVQRNATRSSVISNLARFLPTKEAVTSICNSNSSRLNSLNANSTLNLVTANQITPQQYMNDTESNLHTATGTGSDSTLTPKTPKSALNDMTPHVNNNGEEDLNRGLSIKSIGTMRSWFSGLIFAPPVSLTNSNTSLPSTPQAAARPDSGIFPLALNGSFNSTSIPVKSSQIPNGISNSPIVRNVNGNGNNTPIQMVPSTATRSFFGGNLPLNMHMNSPSTSKTLNNSAQSSSFGFGGMTPKSTTTSSSTFWTTSGNGGKPLPVRSETGSSSFSSGSASGGYDYNNTNVNGNEMFIELNPNSPIGDSRPGSEWTNGGRMY